MALATAAFVIIDSDCSFFSIVTHFTITYSISLLNFQSNYCDNNLLILDLKQLNKIMKLYYFYTLKTLWDGQGKIKMYYGMSRVKKQLSRKRSIDHVEIYSFECIDISLVKIK